MKTDSTLAVVRTQLPYVDRRALSEAWFSALHLAHDGRRPIVPQRRLADADREALPALHAARRPGAQPGAVPAPARLLTAAAPSAGTPGCASGAVARKSPRRAVQSAPPPAAVAPLRATFALTIEGARVQLLVRREGPVLRIAALCAERNVETVRRALASADVAMRLRGHAVESHVRSTGDLEVRS